MVFITDKNVQVTNSLEKTNAAIEPRRCASTRKGNDYKPVDVRSSILPGHMGFTQDSLGLRLKTG